MIEKPIKKKRRRRRTRKKGSSSLYFNANTHKSIIDWQKCDEEDLKTRETI